MAAPKAKAKKPAKRFTVKKAGAHTGQWSVIDGKQKPDSHNRIYRNCDTKQEAQDLAKSLNA